MFLEVQKIAMGHTFRPMMLNMNLVNSYELQEDGRTWVVSGTQGFYVKGHIIKTVKGYGIKSLF